MINILLEEFGYISTGMIGEPLIQLCGGATLCLEIFIVKFSVELVGQCILEGVLYREKVLRRKKVRYLIVIVAFWCGFEK